MKFLAAFTALCVAAVHVSAMPAKREGSAAITDVEVLNFALTLEHLENAFYTEGLKKYSEQDFVKAGLPKWVRGRFQEIAEHEATHVAFLETALGSNAVKPCHYNFGYKTLKDFIDFSGMVETVGTSAYTGAAQLISDKGYLTAAASILATEARQTSWVNSAVRGGAPWSTSFETPLDVNQVFTIASGVITSCPNTNAALLPSILKPFPTLTLPPTTAPGQTVQLAFNTTSTPPSYYAAFVSGMDTVFVKLDKNKMVKVPKELYGVVFVIVTTSKTTVDDSVTVAGPAFLNFGFDSQGKPHKFTV